MVYISICIYVYISNYIQSTKIKLEHPKREMIFGSINSSFFIGLFSIASSKVITLILLCIFFGTSSLLHLMIALPIVIALLTIT